MKLYWSPRSPFVRKVLVAAYELGLAGRIELLPTIVGMAEIDTALRLDNPLNKIPTLLLDDGKALHDSLVICQYLDALHGGDRLFPAGPRRWEALTRHSLANGWLDLLVLWRNERLRPAGERSAVLLHAFAAKHAATLDRLERDPTDAPFDIGGLTLGVALSYLDFRFPDLAWREGHPRLARWHDGFAARPSARATEPAES